MTPAWEGYSAHKPYQTYVSLDIARVAKYVIGDESLVLPEHYKTMPFPQTDSRDITATIELLCADLWDVDVKWAE